MDVASPEGLVTGAVTEAASLGDLVTGAVTGAATEAASPGDPVTEAAFGEAVVPRGVAASAEEMDRQVDSAGIVGRLRATVGTGVALLVDAAVNKSERSSVISLSFLSCLLTSKDSPHWLGLYLYGSGFDVSLLKGRIAGLGAPAAGLGRRGTQLNMSPVSPVPSS